MINNNLRKNWDSVKFNELFKYDPREAFNFRKQTLWDEIPFDYLTEEEKQERYKWEVKKVEEKEIDWDYSREDLEKILKNWWITFNDKWKTDTLLKKCIDSNLI